MSNARTGRKATDYEALHHKAAIMFIKDGLSAKEISRDLNLSMSTFSNWRAVGKWNELRPDLQLLKEYKAANLYIKEGNTPAEIAQILSTPEYWVNIWIYTNGWDVMKLMAQSKDATAALIEHFCNYFTSLFPDQITAIAVTKQRYIKTKIVKPKNPKI